MTPEHRRDCGPRRAGGPGPPWGAGPPPWARGPGPRRFVRRVALLLALLFVLIGAAGALVVAAVQSAVGGSPGAAAIAAAVAVLVAIVGGVAIVSRAVRRLAGPIGDVMEAADRIADGDLTTRVAAVRGPGEVRRLGRRFNEMAARLEASDAQRRRLLADVTHELRTPLSVVQGNVEGLLDGLYAPDPARLETILDETRVMGRLLDDLQTLSTAEAGALRLEREPTDVAATAAEVAAAFAPRAAAAGVTLTTAAADGLPAPVVDGLRVRQVLENLVANALRHTPAGGAVAIDVACADDDVEIAVTDTGTGIPPEQLPTVFDRYARSTDSGGTGLGLAIARSLVEAHGGTIRAEATVGGGTTIRVRLPRDA
jgi:signal transduction histidine kinase